MLRRQLETLGIGLLWAALFASAASAKDWPQWGGTDSRNMVSDEENLPDWFEPGKKDPQGEGIDLAATKNVRWVVKLGSMTCSTPAVAGGRIFIGTGDQGQGIFLCLDEHTGKVLWRWSAPPREVPKEIDGRKFWFGIFPKTLGVCSSPAVDGDRVYLVTHRCEVLCLDVRGQPAAEDAAADLPAENGPPETSPSDSPPAAPQAGGAKVLWLVDMWDLGVRPSDACDCSVLVHGDLLYVGTSNGVDRDADARKQDEFRKPPAPSAPSLIALEKKTGRLVAVDDAGIGPRLLHGQWSSPSLGKVGDRMLIFYGGGDGVCYAFEAPAAAPEQPGEQPLKLKTAWSCDCNPPEYKNFGDLDLITHYSRGDRRRTDALNKSNDGTFVGLSEIIATPVFSNNRVYIAIGRDPEHGRGRGALWCIDAAQSGDITNTGKVWSYQGLDRSLSTVSIADGLLYIADVAGRLHCLDAETGQLHWIHEAQAKTWGSTLVADGKIYLPTEKHLWVLAAGKEKRVLHQISLGAPVWSSPVAANGVLYVASKNYLWAVQGAE
jgi:outer membrane protein assembly factor BamB